MSTHPSRSPRLPELKNKPALDAPGLDAPVRGMLFDMDGVLLDSGKAWWHVVRAVCTDAGTPPPDEPTFLATFGQGIAADIEQFFPALDHDTVAAAYERHFAAHLDQLAALPGAQDVLALLRMQNVPFAVCTNTPAPLARAMLAAVGLSVPDALVFGPTASIPEKPAPAMLHHALQTAPFTAAGIGASGVLFVGDSASDAGAADAAGVRFVHRGDAGAGLPAALHVQTMTALGAILRGGGAL